MIPARKTKAAYVELPDNSPGDRLQMLVQNVDPAIGDRLPDGGKQGPGVRRSLKSERSDYVGLGRAVLVAASAIF